MTTIEAEARHARPDEQERLARFTAFGASDLADRIFRRAGDAFAPTWEDLGVELECLVGTYLLGILLRTRLYRMLISIPVAMAVLAISLIVFGRSPFAAGSILAVWGLLGTAAPVGWWTWMSKALPDDAEAGGGLIVAVVQMAIALGAAAGGWVFDASGYQATFSLSAGILLVAGLLTLAAWLGIAKPSPLARQSAAH